MATQLNPYLTFTDQATEAMDFYASVFGGSVERMTYANLSGMPGYDESMADLVSHSALSDGPVTLMAADVPPGMGEPGPNGAIALTGDDEPTLRGWWDALAVGGTIEMPLEPAPWGDIYGTLTDKYGVSWLVNIAS